jgi:hypothetical protein
MAAEKNGASNFDADKDGNGGGRIFSAAESNSPKINLDEEIEKNIRIRTMPRKFKISTSGSDKKTTMIGAIIMIVGLLVLASAVYLAYIFLINPASTPAPVIKNQQEPVNNTPVVSTPVATTTPAAASTTTPVVATSSQQTSPIASSTSNIASSTINQATTTPTVATTTPIISTSTPAAVSTSTSVSSILSSGNLPTGSSVVDSDKDGLSDPEELIFGTDPNKKDSDGDGYSDGAEVLNLYNPAGTGKITDNPHIAVYQDAAAKFSVDYPKIWTAQNLNNGQSVIFSAADNSFVEIVSMPDIGRKSIKDWYNNQFPDTPATDADVISKNGWQGIFHQSKETFYLVDAAKNNIYTISYTPVSDSKPDYYHIFLMMINSFILK